MNLKNSALQEIALSLHPSVLELILFPTEHCNFRCLYCYEDYKIGRMKPEVTNGIKNLLYHRSKTIELLKVSWFGGEPLLAMDVITDISKTILELKKENPNLKYHADITTNGYLLTKELAKELLHLGIISYQISLDGDRELHDNTRILSNGKGSFDIIMSNLLALKEIDQEFTVLIRIHYQKSTFNQLKSLINDLEIQFGGDLRFLFFFKAVERLGGSNDESIDRLSSEEKVEIETKLGGFLSDTRQISRPNASQYICYASKPNSFAIRANGRVAKCTVALNDERNDIGYIQEDGKLCLFQEKIRPWIKGIESLDLKTLACPYSHF